MRRTNKIFILALVITGLFSGILVVKGDYYGSGGSIYLNQSLVNLNIGQTVNVTIFGGYGPYIMYQNSSNIFNAYIAGNTITINAINQGSGSVNICSSYGSTGCATLYVNINQNNYYNPNYNPNYYNPYYPTPTPYSTYWPITFNQPNVSLTIDQTVSIIISGGNSNNYFISHNSNLSGVSASISGNTLNLRGLMPSSNVISVCYSTNSCGAVTVTVGPNYNYNPGYNYNYNNYNYNYQNQGNWIYCSSENGQCFFSGTRQVRYGANSSYYYHTATNNIFCSNSMFGDPAYGIAKQCYYSGSY